MSPPRIRRSISVDSIAPTLSSLFSRKRSRRSFESNETPVETPQESSAGEAESNEDQNSDDEEYESVDELKNNGDRVDLPLPVRKRRKTVKTAKQIEFEENERKLDEELPEDLRKFRPKGYKFNIPPKDRPIRVYADGVFDLFHLGHMKQLEQAKKSFPNVQLVCGIPSDIETHKRKGLTVLTDQQRIETLQHCRWVDEVIPNAPWCVNTDFLLKHKLDYVAHDDLPYASTDSDDIYKPIKEMGMFLTTQRTEGISTSDIITKIIRDYDKYLMRNFARGATRKELNVSWLKKNELEFKKHINDFRTYWKRNQTNINNVSRDLYFEVREYMRGRKFDMASFLENASVNSEKSSGLNSIASSRGSSPLTDFAAKYIGNANKELNRERVQKKNLFANVKEWMLRDDSHDEYSTNDEMSKDPTVEPKVPKIKQESAKSSGKTEAKEEVDPEAEPDAEEVAIDTSKGKRAASSPKKPKKVPNKKTKKSS